MNINTKLKHTAISLVIALILAVSAAPVLPAYAAVGTSVNEEVINQARSIASLIQTRVQIYWSDWVDKQIPYTQDPLANDEPTWATDTEVLAAIGGYNVDGIDFAVDSMPLDRQGSFYLIATIGDNMGGAAAASYVRNFLPMAVASGNTVAVPVLRPSFALGLSDLADNPNKVNRDGTTDDGEPTFIDNTDVTFGENGSITFDPVTGGNINNVNNLDARNITVSDTLTTNTANITGNAAIDGDLTVGGNITGNLTGNTTGTHTGAVIGNVTGNVTGNLTGDVTGNSSTATRLATARTIALNTGATGTATAFSGAANISIPVTALNAGYLNAGTVPVGRLTGDYGINITGKATAAGLADTAKYASGAGLLKDTDGEIAGSFTMRTLANGTVEFGGTTPRTSVTFGGSGVVQPADYWFGSTGTGVLHGQSTSATKLHNIRTIALGTGATGTATAFDGTSNIVIPITALNAGYLNAGTVESARLTGTYNIGISGKANTAGQADNATNVNGGTVSATTGAFSGALTAGGAVRINESDLTIYGNHTDRSIVFDGVDSAAAKWRLMHSATGSGDANYFRLQSTGSAGSSYSDVVRFGMDTKDAVFSGNVLPTANNSKNLGSATYKFANVYATNLNGTLTGNASSATRLAAARTISLGTGATGTATAFDGTANITIPVTALNAGYLNTGTVESARLSGTYNIGISGKAATAGAADTAVNATNAGTATNVSGGSVNATTGAFSGSVTTDYNFITNGGSVYFKAPVTTGGWARGINYFSSDGTTTYGGIGMLGGGTTPNSFYIGWGSSPHAPTYGLTMGTTGATSLKGSLNVSNGITGALTGNASSATRLATARTIALGTGITGTATAFDGTANITIPVTALNAGYLNTGTVESARLSGTYNIGISGKAATAGAADTAGTSTNVNGGTVSATTGAFSGALTVNGASRFNNDMTIYGNATDRSLVFDGVSSTVAKWRLTHSASGNGDANYFRLQTTGATGSTYADVLRFGMDTKDAVFSGNILSVADNTKNLGSADNRFANIYATNLTGSLTGNATTATKLAVARTIALGTAATGTATAFDGTSNIVIPVTEVNATYLKSGTVQPGRLSGTYNIGISGKAATAGAADTATSASSATKLATARSLNVTGAATGTAATFDGTGNANIAVTKLDPAKLMTVGQTVGTRHNAVAFNSGQSGATGTIKITIPGTGINTMMNIEIDVYEYNANSASKIIVGGYAYSNGPSWANASATILGNYNKGVRLAYNGTNFSILLGTTSTVWSYPKVMVTKVTAGHNNVDTVVSGEWTAFLVTDESDITWSATPTQTAAQSATKLAAARTISLGTGATGTATAFDGSANITIPVTSLNATYLNSGTVEAARLSGTYAIGISGKAATAGVADTATSANSAVTATNVSGGSVNATTGSFSGLLTANKGIQLNRAGGATTGINYYSPSYTSWQTIMSPAGTASGVSGNVTSPAGTYVTSWALRNIVEPSTGYGWTWESLPISGTTSAIVAELSSATGNFKTKGSVTAADGFSGTLTGNASTATQLAVARTIALGTGVTGTATAFNGTANITIPVTALNAGYLSAGTIPAARLTGSYGIDIGGTARYAKELSNPITSVAYADMAGSATNVNGGTVNATTGVFTGTVYAPNFTSVGTHDVFLASPIPGRGLTVGYSGSDYSGIGYNIQHTATSGSFIAPQADTVSYLKFASGGFQFYTAPAGTAGRTTALTNVAWIDKAGNAGFGGSVTAPTFIGSLSGTASSATYATSAGTATSWQPLATSQGFGQYYTVPAGGTWLVWMHTINYNSTSSGGVGIYIVSGGTTLDAGNLQTKTPWWAIKIKN